MGCIGRRNLKIAFWDGYIIASTVFGTGGRDIPRRPLVSRALRTFMTSVNLIIILPMAIRCMLCLWFVRAGPWIWSAREHWKVRSHDSPSHAAAAQEPARFTWLSPRCTLPHHLYQTGRRHAMQHGSENHIQPRTLISLGIEPGWLVLQKSGCESLTKS